MDYLSYIMIAWVDFLSYFMSFNLTLSLDYYYNFIIETNIIKLELILPELILFSSILTFLFLKFKHFKSS
jgi:hypothetical protein